MSENNGLNKILGYLLFAVAGFGVILTVGIELSYKYPVILELCGGAAGACADVQSTPFGKIFGVSVGYWGLLSYIAFIFLALYAPAFTLPFAAALMGGELYFLWVMNQILHMYCLFCVMQFFTVTALFLLTVAWRWNSREYVLPGKMWSTPVVVLLVFALFVAPVMFRGGDTAPVSDQLVTYWGDPEANVRVELYSDFQCGFCNKLEPEIDKLMENHPDVLIVFRDFIISSHSLSPLAVSFANGVAFTKGREAFLKTRREMFENQKKLREYLKAHLPEVEFTDELKKKIRAKVDKDLEKAKANDIYQTPTMVIYRGGDVVQVIRGYTRYEKFSRFLNP